MKLEECEDTDEREVLKALKKISHKKTSGMDGITSAFLKHMATWLFVL